MTTLNGHPLISLSLVVPRVGIWTADVEVDTDEAIAGVVTLDLDGRPWRGSVVAGAQASGRWAGRLVGAGGLQAILSPVALASTTLRAVLAEALRAAGETAATSTGDLSAAVTRWHRTQSTGAQEVAEVALRAGMAWRVLADGTVWVGTETWPDADLGSAVDVIERDPIIGRYELAGDGALDARPGTLVQLRDDEAGADVFVRVGAVVHRLQGVALRTSILEEQQETLAGRLWAAFESIVLRITRRHDRHGSFGARVVAQEAGGGLLDLQPDDPRRPSCSRVPYRTLPGLKVEIPAGSRVSFTYEDGDPRRPLVVLWDPSTAAGKWSVYGGTRRVARDGENVVPGGAALPPTGMAGWMTQVSTAIATLTSGATSLTPPTTLGTVDGGTSEVRVP